jgi:hypothetical protein
MLDRQPILEPPHPKQRVVEVDLVASETDRLADAQTVPKHRENEEMIADSVAPVFGGVEQSGDFRFTQEILAPLMSVRGGHRDTFYISPAGGWAPSPSELRRFPLAAGWHFLQNTVFVKSQRGGGAHAMATEPFKAKDDAAAPLERWILTRLDRALIQKKHHANRLSFAVLLAFFRNEGRFPRTASEVDDLLVEEMAQQLAIAVPSDFTLSLAGRTAEGRRAEIRALLGFREASVADAELLEDWLKDRVAALGAVTEQLAALLEARCRELSIEPPADDRIERIVRAAIHAHDESFLDAGMPNNPGVKISRKRNKEAWITVTPFDPQPDPPNLTAIKAETLATCPMTSLLDMLKETDLRLNFTDVLKSPTAYETLDRAVLRPRLLLWLNGLGTNAGFQRMAGLQSGVTAKDLGYVRRRYISVDALRQAIAIVTNGVLRARNPAIQQSGATARRRAHRIRNTSAPGTRTGRRNGTCVTAGAAS